MVNIQSVQLVKSMHPSFQGFYRRADLTRHLRLHEGLPSRERSSGDKFKNSGTLFALVSPEINARYCETGWDPPVFIAPRNSQVGLNFEVFIVK